MKRNVTDVVPVHVKLDPPVDQPTEAQLSELFTQAGRIVIRMQTPHSSTTALLKKLRQNLSALDKDEVREELKQEISTALEAGGIPSGMIRSLMMVFVNMSMNNFELAYAGIGESIVLYLRCLSLEGLLALREIILSGLLLRLLSEVIKQFIESRARVQLVVKREDYNMCLSYFTSAPGNLSSFYLTLYCIIAN